MAQRPPLPEPALQAIQDAWNAAARTWNADGLAAIYTEDALFFGGRPGHFIGANAIRDYFASYEGIIESGAMSLVDQHVIRLDSDTLLAQGHVEFSFVLSGGRSTRSRLRTTLTLVRDASMRWKLRQHHFSPDPAAPPLGNDA
jgi:uncharacterized protein (TIGR02246 family)